MGGTAAAEGKAEAKRPVGGQFVSFEIGPEVVPARDNGPPLGRA
jgi:hypothetical protein